MRNSASDYCSCGGTIITSGFEDDFGYWDVCVRCGKKKEDGYHYYNHYDGTDYEVFYGSSGDIETDWDND